MRQATSNIAGATFGLEGLTAIQKDSQHIQLWVTRYDQIDDPALVREYARILSQDERQRQSCFRLAQDRHRYLVTHALLRLLLSRHMAVAPADWSFVTNDYGRPQVANNAPDIHRIRFNISHTNSLIVVAIAFDREVGVDTENIVANAAPIEVADRFFAPDEVSELRSLAAKDQQRRFFEYWTLKESYIKARGMGLSIPLDMFCFRLPRERIELVVDPAMKDDSSRWLFWQFQLAPAYMVALCAQRINSEPVRLTIKQAVPLVTEETVHCSILRVSAHMPTAIASAISPNAGPSAPPLAPADQS